MDIKTLIDNAEKIKDKGNIKRTSLTVKIKRFEEIEKIIKEKQIEL